MTTTPPLPSGKSWFSIANQLRFGLGLIVTAALLASGSLLIYAGFQTELSEMTLLQQERSRAAAEIIDAYLDDLLRKLNYLARVRGLTDLPPDTKQTMLEALTRHNQAYEMIAILDREGNVGAFVAPYGAARPDSMSGSALFIRTFRKHEEFVADVSIDPTIGQPVTTLAVPIRNAEDKVDGVLLARVNLKFLNFVASQTEVGQTGYAYVVDNRNRLIALKGNDERAFRLEDVSRLPFLGNTAITRAQPLSVYAGLNGAEVLGAVAPVRNVNWFVVVELPTAEAYAPLRRQILTMGISLLVSIAVATLIGFFFSQRIVSPFQRLTAAASQIRDGNLDVHVGVDSRNELGILAQAFNTMVARLRESFRALETANEELEERVAHRTVELKAALDEIADLNTRLQAENVRMSAELDVTRRLQQMILPREDEVRNIDGLDIAGFMEPADEVGGDYYDVLSHDGRVKIGIGDVTGHGLESGVVMIMAQTAVRTLMTNNESDPVKFLNTINRVIFENTRRMQSQRNMTFAMLEYESDTLRLSGQHEDVILVRSRGDVEKVDTFDLGFPLGVESDISSFVSQTELRLEQGDVLALYTDGITEAVNSEREQFGLDRLCASLTAHRDGTARAIRVGVVEDLKRFIGEQKIFDDITLLIIKKT